MPYLLMFGDTSDQVTDLLLIVAMLWMKGWVTADRCLHSLKSDITPGAFYCRLVVFKSLQHLVTLNDTPVE